MSFKQSIIPISVSIIQFCVSGCRSGLNEPSVVSYAPSADRKPGISDELSVRKEKDPGTTKHIVVVNAPVVSPNTGLNPTAQGQVVSALVAKKNVVDASALVENTVDASADLANSSLRPNTPENVVGASTDSPIDQGNDTVSPAA
jgi:hypothetical protein